MTAGKKRGRQLEAEKVRQANRANAVSRPMLGEFTNLTVFLTADSIELESQPRRNLKSGYHDIKKRLSSEINLFIRRKFQNLSIEMMNNLYEAIKAQRGLEITLDEFESKFSKFNPRVINCIPPHCTLVFLY